MAAVGPDPWSLNRLTVRVYDAFRGVASDGALPEHYGVLLNVLLFVPLGWLLSRVVRWPWWAVTVAAMAASAGVELLQMGHLEREAQLVDVVANTLGGLVGAVVAGLGSRRAQDAG